MSMIARSAWPPSSGLDARRSSRRGVLHAQVHALGVVVAALQGEVDAGVHGVGREVEQQRRVLVGPAVAVAADRAAAGRRQRGGDGQHEDERAAAEHRPHEHRRRRGRGPAHRAA